MADELAPAQARIGLKHVVRHVAGVAVGVVILLLLFGRRGELAAAGRHVIGVKVGWVAAAIAAEALSLLTFACLQHRVLRLAGAAIGLGGLVMLSLANDAIALSVPGEPAVSSAYRYRYYRRRGATGAASGWTIFTILIAQAIGMSLMLLLGVLVALTGSTSTRNVGAAAVGLVIVIGSLAILIRRDLVLRLAAALVRVARPALGTIGARVESTLARMREIPLGPDRPSGSSRSRPPRGRVISSACCAASARCTRRFPGTACCWHTAWPRSQARSRSSPAGSASSRAASR